MMATHRPPCIDGNVCGEKAHCPPAATPDLAELRRIAEAADHGGRTWEWRGGYPQCVVRQGDVAVVADVCESPDAPSRFAEHIATFDPPTVLDLIARLEAAEAAVTRMREVEAEIRTAGLTINREFPGMSVANVSVADMIDVALAGGPR